jgi:hypothetical protein
MTTTATMNNININNDTTTAANTATNLFTNNDDWEVTKEIYADSVIEDGVVDIPISFNDIVGIRRVILPPELMKTVQDANNHNDAVLAEMGFHDDDNNNDHMNRGNHEKGNDDIQSTFEYMILSESSLEPPVVRLAFTYKEGDDDDDYGLIELDSVSIELRHIPPELSPSSLNAHSTDEWLEWLTTKANEILNEEKLSFNVCEFIEHQAVSYFNFVHRDEVSGYSCILFDEADQTETPPTIPPEEALEKVYSGYPHLASQVSSSPWKKSKLYATTYANHSRRTPKGKSNARPSSNIDEYAIQTIQQQWTKWLNFECPICFDTLNGAEGVELPCRHFLCKECTRMYIQSKLSELHLYRQSPFICPLEQCKQGMKIKSGAYPLSDEEVRIIEDWKFNLSYPKTHVLSICPRKKCQSSDMRRASTDTNETMVFCNSCQKAFCELCVKIYKDTIEESIHTHKDHICNEALILKLCRRYNHASEEIKCKADEKWHWLKEYALNLASSKGNTLARLWVSENASQCPTCRTGIERIEGCFHMHCTCCGTHFCYDCGDEIHRPFYGTHHCWEEGRRLFDQFD